MVQVPGVLLVPVDGSEGADAAVSFAAALAAALHGLPLRLLFAFPENALHVLGVPPETIEEDQLDAYSPAQFVALRDKRAKEVFVRARRLIGEAAAPVEEVLLAGDPASAILDYARTVDAPMIVMGSRGLSPFSEMLLGSVSQRVLHHAGCPVTIVHK